MTLLTDTFESAQPRGPVGHGHRRRDPARPRIHAPREAVFEVVSAAAPAPQNPNTGVRKLVVRLPGKVSSLRLDVSLTPLTPYREGSAEPVIR